MGNEASSTASAAVADQCGVDCRKEKKLQQTEAAYQALSSDPNADPVARQQAFEAYMQALHGPSWKFQQGKAEQATAANKAGMLTGQYDDLEELQQRGASLEQLLDDIEDAIQKTSDKIRDTNAELAKGHQYIVTMRRAIELKGRYVGST